MPKKTCKHCGASCGPRTLKCPGCERTFVKSEKPKPKLSKDGRGKKACPECGTINGVRSFHCKNCDFAFKMSKMRKTPRIRPVEDWKMLAKRQKVRVLGGSGPYYVGEDGERRYLSDRGVYIVQKVTDKGIEASYEGTFVFLWMAPKEKSPLCDNLYRAPHRLMTVNG